VGDDVEQTPAEAAYPSIKLREILQGAHLGRSVKGVLRRRNQR
jgi:hypothetical protein